MSKTKAAKGTDKAKALRDESRLRRLPDDERKAVPPGRTLKSSREITMTPERAQKLLDNNKVRNRPINEAHVRGFMEDIRAGRFVVTHESIAIDAEGNIIDGQHRLTAIARCGIPVRVLFAEYAEGATIPMDKLNIGKTRRPGDVLEIADIVPPGKGKAVASMATALWIGLTGTSASPSRERQLRIVQAHKDDMLAVLNLPKVAQVTALVKAAMAYAWPTNRQGVSDFARRVCEKLEVAPRSGAAALNSYLASTRGRMRSTDADTFVRVLIAMQADFSGKTVDKLIVKSIGPDNGAVRWFASKRRGLGLLAEPHPPIEEDEEGADDEEEVVLIADDEDDSEDG